MLSGYNHDYFSDKIGYFCGLQIELEANDLTCREKLIHIGEVVKKVILAIGLGTTMGRLKLSLSNTFVLANVHMTTHTHHPQHQSFVLIPPLQWLPRCWRPATQKRLSRDGGWSSAARWNRCWETESEILMLQVTNKVFPWPAISWYKDGALLSSQDPRVTITSKKYVSLMSPSNQKVSSHCKFDFSWRKRSSLMVSSVGAGDGGLYRWKS